MNRSATTRNTESGATLVFVLLLVVGLLTLTTAGLFAARSDLRISENYKTGVQALLAAESGLLHARKAIDNSGVIRFDTDVVPLWDTLFGSGPLAVSGHTGITYEVTALDDWVNPLRFVRLRSVGRAPGEAQRTMEARLQLDGVYSPGAIYLPGATIDPTFNGTNFLIDGNNRNLNGTANTIAPSVPGIATSTQTNADVVLDELSSSQEDGVIGPTGPASVFPAAGASAEQITNSIVPDFLSRAGVVTNPTLNGNDIFGTTLLPQITHFTGNVTINGTLNGAGILVVDQGLTISGNASFTGLIIVRGTTEITAVSGNATILGALWTTDVDLTVAGSASVTYSTQALELVNALLGGNGIPERVKVVAWWES